MAPRKKAADEAATSTPAPDASGAPALPDNPPEASSAAPEVPPELETSEDDHTSTLAAIAAEEATPPAEAPPPAAEVPVEAPQTSAASDLEVDESVPVLTDEQREIVRLKREKLALEGEVRDLQERIGEIRSSAQTEIDRLKGVIEGSAHKPPPAPVLSKDPLREAKSFGVLATWLGPGVYGGPYFTITGVRMPQAVGMTTGYFPKACVDRFVDQFKVT